MAPATPETPCLTLDQLIRRRARTHSDKALLTYASASDEDDIVEITGADLERWTRVAAGKYDTLLRGDAQESANRVVAIVGVSNLEYYLTFLAVQRLGYSTMLLSPRLADQGYIHLLREAGCGLVIASAGSRDIVLRVRPSLDTPVELISMVGVAQLQSAEEVHDMAPLEVDDVSRSPELIVHSGGTTGLPKPVHLRSGRYLAQLSAAPSAGAPDQLSTLPLFHTFGLVTLFANLIQGTQLSLLDADRPITVSAISRGLDRTGSKMLVAVPYILKFFAETQDGIDRLAQLSQVMTAGSAMPDHLGDKLLDAGVKLSQFYGQTECGVLMVPTADQWNWLTPLPFTAPYLKFEPVEDDLYHLVVLPGLQSKVLADRPDGSYGTRDLFHRHPTDPSKWKFASRYDDLIVLVNGEKADPIPLEEALMSNSNVQVAVAFGSGRDSLGIIVIPSENAGRLNISTEKLVESLLPNLALGNSRVPAYAMVSSSSLIVKEPGTEYPVTDKSTVIRSRFIAKFAADIDRHYADNEEVQSNNSHSRHLSDMEIHDCVLQAIKSALGLSNDDAFKDDMDFFAVGMDSLQASRVRAELVKRVGIRQPLAANMVFDYPTVASLTRYLLDRRNGVMDTKTPAEVTARSLVQKYSNLLSHSLRIELKPNPVTNEFVVLLTGATGSLGCQILHSLLLRDDVAHVYCLVRAENSTAATLRVQKALDHASLRMTDELASKFTGLACDLSSETFGLSTPDYELLKSSVTTIIHNAWAVNFSMSLPSFEPHCIASTFHLVNLALQSRCQAAFIFISSISAVSRATPFPIKEIRHGWDAVPTLGYGQSKWVTEEILHAAAARGLRCRVLRVGQVSGDTKHGVWNSSEAIPSIVHSAKTIGALPDSASAGGLGDDSHFWLPSDIAATAINEIALLNSQSGHDELPSLQIFHVSNPLSVNWREFLQALKRLGLVFEIVPHEEWVQRLKESDPDPVRNPPYRLIEFFKGGLGGSISGGHGAYPLDITEAAKCAPSLRQEIYTDDALIGKYLKYWVDQAWSAK